MAVTVKNETGEKKKAVDHAKPVLHVIPQVLKGDTFLVMSDTAKELEDEFVSLYEVQSAGTGVVLKPPFEPKVLKHWVKHNSILNQCVHAMEVNIDGTGNTFVNAEDTAADPDPTQQKAAKSFFDTPWPGLSFITLRRQVRRDMEDLGYGFMEVVRDLGGAVAGLRQIEGQTMRLLKLGDAKLTEHEVMRNGQKTKMKAYTRHRRFAQTLDGKTLTYFKEFNCPFSLHRTTGEWAADGTKWPAADEATELLFFGVDRDTEGPYYVPRWINTMPAVVGGRKAEEENLGFLDSGGMPPAIIFIQGGAMVGDASNQLKTYLSGKNKNRNRAVVVELQSNSGNLDSTGTVSAKVERFGADKANDSMFQNYLKESEDKVRTAFRLPLLFFGRSEDYNFATALTAYMVAEAQVFAPERTEFDEIINRTLMPALGFDKIKFQSNPITLKDVDNMLKALDSAKDVSEGEGWMSELNALTGLKLKYKEPEPAPLSVGQVDPATGKVITAPVPPAANDDGTSSKGPKNQPGKTEKKAAAEIRDLAYRFAVAQGLLVTKHEVGPQETAATLQEVQSLAGDDLLRFTSALASLTPMEHGEHVH